MEVHVIEFDSLSKLQVPWAISRPGQSAQETDDITFDAQIMEFCHVTLEMTVPIIIRDLVFGYRDHIAWAQGTRVQDPINNLRLWGIGPPEDRQLAINVMANEKRQGVPQDAYRQHVPLDAYTTFACKLSVRRLAKMFKYCSSSASPMIREFGDELALSIWASTGHDIVLSRLAGKVSDESPWPKIEGMESYDLGPIFVPYMLFAQILRHRNLEIHTYLDDMFSAERMARLTQGNEIQVAIKGSKHFIRDIAAKRNCWIAQGDLWAPILDALKEDDDKVHLPCDGSTCPFVADNWSRIRGEDPNPPCPIFMNEVGDFDRTDDTIHYAETRGRDSDFWKIKCKELL